MLTIYKKELKSYFRSFLGWLFMAVLLFFLGIYFTYYNMSAGTPYLAYSISSVLFFVLLLIPILTMKIWAEERRQKTDQLLFTAPVRTGEVLWGKFLAIETILAMVVIVFACYMFFLAHYGTIPVGENLLSLAAFFLFGTACLSIGFFVSSWTENLVISAILSYVVLMVCAFIPNITGLFSATGNAFTRTVNQVFDIASHLNAMMNGIVDIGAIAYYLSVTALMLFGTWMVIQARRKPLFYNVRTTCLNIGKIAGMLILTVLVNIVIGKMPATMTQYDITMEQMYSLTEETEQILNDLEEDITIYVLADQAEADQAIDTILGRYEAGSSHITVSYKNPEEFPAFADFYTSEDLETNSLIIVGQDRYKVIPYSDCYEISYSIDYSTYEYYETMTGFDGEGQITAGINYVTSDAVPVVYEVTGHEEYALPEPLLNRLSKLNIELKSINLMQYESVPEDAAAILICGPIIDFSTEDMDKVRAYLAEGGNAMLFTAFSTEDMSRYEALLPEYGLELAEGVVFEASEYYYKELPYYLMPVILDADQTGSLYENNRLLLLAQCRGIMIAEDYDTDHIYITPLVMTSDEAYSKANVTTMETMDQETGDIQGPFYLAVAVEKEQENGAVSKLIVTGTEYVVDSDINDYTADANYEYLLSCIQSLAGTEEESMVSIPVKSYELSMILVSSGAANVCATIIVVVIPVGLLIAGIVIMVVRRRRNKGARSKGKSKQE